MNIKRSDFIKFGSMTAVGAMAVPSLLNSCANATGSGGAPCTGPGWDIEERIKELGLVLPAAPRPGLFKPVLVVGNMLYTSGLGPDMPIGVETDLPNNGTQIIGRVGEDLTLEGGKVAARYVGLTMLAILKEYFGDLNKICRLVKTLGMVNCTADFRSSPAVINGFSELMAEIFGEENGIGVRSAVGMMLPFNIAVEVEAVFELHTSTN